MHSTRALRFRRGSLLAEHLLVLITVNPSLQGPAHGATFVVNTVTD
jgi:hypothetical protein